MSKCIAIIPARYDSERFPGKLLETIKGKSILQLVYEQVSKAHEVDQTIIATDDDRIENAANLFAAEVERTFRTHKSGTDRCAQVARRFWRDDIIINVQGDEPFISPDLIDELALKMKQDDWLHLSTMRSKIDDCDEIVNSSTVKVVCDHSNKALYFSRSVIPFPRNTDVDALDYYKHIGIYAFRNKTLQEITALPTSTLENIEKLEQLRWLENGYPIYAFKTTYNSLGIDTPEDLEKAKEMLDK